MIMVMARLLPLLLVLWVSNLAAARLVTSTSCQDIFSLSVVWNALLECFEMPYYPESPFFSFDRVIHMPIALQSKVITVMNFDIDLLPLMTPWPDLTFLEFERKPWREPGAAIPALDRYREIESLL